MKCVPNNPGIRLFFRRVAVLILLCAVILPVCPAKAASVSHKLIAFTFDDGPSSTTTPVLLDGLEARGVVATFFMNGVNGSHGTVRHHGLMERMLKLGCQLGNHTYSHASFAKLSAEQVVSEVQGVEKDLYAIAGGPYLEMVRTPGGANTERIRANVGHPIILWSIDPFDWRDRNEETVYERIMSKAHDGGIILLHDLYATSVAAALRAMDDLKGQGYEFVTVSELFRRRGVYMQNGVVYTSAPSHAETGVTYDKYTAPAVGTGVDPVSGKTTMVISSDEPGLTAFHYTTDGSTPTLGSPLYEGPTVITQDTSVRVAGFDRFGTRSPVNEKTIHTGTAMPRIESESHGKITLSCPTPGASIYYTTDGSDPRTSGTAYAGVFTPGKVTRAVAIVTGRARSDVVEIVKLSSGALYSDIPSSAWYLNAVDDVVKQGLMKGVEAFRFGPEIPLTRAALVSILYRMEGNPSVAGLQDHNFRDVPDGTWYTDAVRWAAANGIATGRIPNQFEPNGTLTRQQAAVILQRYALWAGKTGQAGGSLAAYRDADQAAPYAQEALLWCQANGLLEGLGIRLYPEGALLRAQAAAMISGLCRIKK